MQNGGVNQSDPPGASEEQPSERESQSRRVLMGTAPEVMYGRRVLRRLPSAPRCKMCAAPFAGPFGPLMRIMGRKRWPANPKYCGNCFRELTVHRAGAEIPCSVLFADVRGSTSLAEGMRPMDFRDQMDRFFDSATRIVLDHDGMVDKFVGDEIMAMFIPGIAGEAHARRAIEAGKGLIAETEHGLPIGAGVTSGISFVGAVGAGEKVEMSAMGDNVNIAARLASAAGARELLVTAEAAEAAGMSDIGLEHRSLPLKGKSELTNVVVFTAGAPNPSSVD